MKFMVKRLAIFSVVVLLLVVGLFFWWNISLKPANINDTKTVSFVISKGSPIRETIKQLHDQGLIRDQIAFFLLIKKLGLERSIQAGSFKLSPSMPAEQLAMKLTVGTEDRWITVLEGWRNEEVLEYLNKEKIGDGKWEMGVEVGKWKMDEGRLFPDTYLVPKDASVDYIHNLLRKTFDKKTADLTNDINKSGLTMDQVLTLASLVEREARTDGNRAMVADVLIKRLKANMALDVDATIQYALGKQPDGKWWKKELTLEDLKIKSPYNTYRNPGLPPSPICNPSLSSIKAVVYPSGNPYYFYITDKQGVMHYTKTLSEHNVNVAKYLQGNTIAP